MFRKGETIAFAQKRIGFVHTCVWGRPLRLRHLTFGTPIGFSHSKIITQGQTVLPRLVREEPGLKPGDTVRFIIDNGTVTLLKNHSTDDNPFHAFTEWASQEDDDTYTSL